MDRLNDLAAALQSAHVLESLLPLLLKITLIALIGRLVMAALPKASAATRYLVAVTTFISMLVTPLVAVSGIEWKLALLPPERAAKADVRDADDTTLAKDALVRSLPQPVAKTIGFVESLQAGWRGWLLLVLAATSVAFLGRMIVGVIAIAFVTKGASEVADDELIRDLDRSCELLGVDGVVRLLASNRVNVPLTWGIRRPVLLLPAEALEWSRERLRVIFLHELAHLRRSDAVTLLITRGATALYWFHPLAWSLDRAARRECEQACDDLVLASGTRASDYADHLLEIARALPKHDPFGAVTLAMSRRSQLEGRLLSILHPHASRSTVSRRLAVAAAIVAGIIVLPVAALRVTAEPAPAPTEVMKHAQSEVTVVARNDSKPKREFRERDDDASVRAYEELRGNHEAKADEWYQSGKDLLRHGQNLRAIDAFNEALRLEPFMASAMYNVACAYALEGDGNRALDTLEEAVKRGYSNAEHMREDEDLESIRSSSRFESIAQLADDLAIRQDGDDWSGAVPRYEQVLRQHSDLGRAWFNAGFVRLMSGDTNGARIAFTRALDMGHRPATTMYNLACTAARAGQKDVAFDWLDKAADAGMDIAKMCGDEDLESLRGDVRFAKYETSCSHWKHKSQD